MDTPDIHLYEYSIVRYMPSVERGESVNIGLVMMCKRAGWLRVRFGIDAARVRALWHSADIDALKTQTRGMERIAAADRDAGPIAALEAHERFRWLTAVRSAAVRTSPPHPGLAADLDATFDRLFNDLVAES